LSRKQCAGSYGLLKRVVLIGLVGCSGLCHAAEWTLKGWLDQSLSYDDNVFLNPDGQSTDPRNSQQGRQGSFQYKITPVLSFLHQTDISDVEGSASYGTQVYTDVEGLDFDVQRYSLRGAYKTELIDWGLAGNYSIIPTRNTAVLDSGVYNVNIQNSTWSLAPTITFKIDEVNSLKLAATYSESTFDRPGNARNNNQSSFFNDNTNANVDIAWQRLWTERYSTAISWFYNTVDYGPQQPSNDGNSNANNASSFESTGLNFTNNYMLSEKWKLDGTIGFRQTDSQSNIAQANSSSTGFLANIGVNYTDERYSGGLNFSRSLVPSTFGQLQEQTSFGLNYNYKITERLSAGLSASYQESTFVIEGGSQVGNDSQTRKNIFINPTVHWQLAQDWSLTGSYRYRSQTGFLQGNPNQPTAQLIDQTADSNLFLLSINYNWKGLKMSR
jgi:hypothetical protein